MFSPTPQREKLGGFLVANFLSYFPKEKWLRIFHSPNFRKFHHIFHGKERNLSPVPRSGGDFTQSFCRNQNIAMYSGFSWFIISTFVQVVSAEPQGRGTATHFVDLPVCRGIQSYVFTSKSITSPALSTSPAPSAYTEDGELR